MKTKSLTASEQLAHTIIANLQRIGFLPLASWTSIQIDRGSYPIIDPLGVEKLFTFEWESKDPLSRPINLEIEMVKYNEEKEWVVGRIEISQGDPSDLNLTVVFSGPTSAGGLAKSLLGMARGIPFVNFPYDEKGVSEERIPQ